jgi:hypothetical protein
MLHEFWAGRDTWVGFTNPSEKMLRARFSQKFDRGNDPRKAAAPPVVPLFYAKTDH